MQTRRMTNILLLLIFLCLAGQMIFKYMPMTEAVAQPISVVPMTEKCVTFNPSDKPEAYLHVVIYNAPGQQKDDIASFR